MTSLKFNFKIWSQISLICIPAFTVRLSRGDHSHGVVQIMEESWAVLCGEGFTNKEAKVVCGQLGFQDGMALALGSFGTFYGRYVRPNISCNGTEKTILDCSYDEFRGCQKDSFLGYAVVSCFNGKLSKGTWSFFSCLEFLTTSLPLDAYTTAERL